MAIPEKRFVGDYCEEYFSLTKQEKQIVTWLNDILDPLFTTVETIKIDVQKQRPKTGKRLVVKYNDVGLFDQLEHRARIKEVNDAFRKSDQDIVMRYKPTKTKNIYIIQYTFPMEIA